ncbi:hypothetical protein Cni_G26145 [Canna indica]|uniref:Uncharacterized protein n=1 Tax=Canna indica TaxID=4628 RepID=A0AAQ3QQ02_9LILI|nr:hypothetical protein Cni_G26145 [Canna indica]
MALPRELRPKIRGRRSGSRSHKEIAQVDVSDMKTKKSKGMFRVGKKVKSKLLNLTKAKAAQAMELDKWLVVAIIRLNIVILEYVVLICKPIDQKNLK